MNGEKPLDDIYFEWLYNFIGNSRNRNPERGHWELAKRLYITEFKHFVPNDNNRAMDGKELRERFIDEQNIKNVDQDWMDLECSMLEMLIALSERADFHAFDGTANGGVGGWFWKLMENINLKKYTDAVINDRDLEVIDKVIAKVNNRTYRPNGRGGLFPLKRPEWDQQIC